MGLSGQKDVFLKTTKKDDIRKFFVCRHEMEATPRFELGNKGFADLCLTTWLCRHKKPTKRLQNWLG